LEGGELVVAAYTGPRGDAYRPDAAPSRDEALEVHAPQVEALARSGVDLIVAATLPSLEEARGIAARLARSGVDWMLSFVVRREGTLLDGAPLADAIARIDDEVSGAPLGFAVNCVHPDVFRAAIENAGPAAGRVVSLQANASARAPEELDGSESVQGDEPGRWAAAMLEAGSRRRCRSWGDAAARARRTSERSRARSPLPARASSGDARHPNNAIAARRRVTSACFGEAARHRRRR
jgi:homocysteine S-methyltransferase